MIVFPRLYVNSLVRGAPKLTASGKVSMARFCDEAAVRYVIEGSEDLITERCLYDINYFVGSTGFGNTATATTKQDVATTRRRASESDSPTPKRQGVIADRLF